MVAALPFHPPPLYAKILWTSDLKINLFVFKSRGATEQKMN